MISNVRFIDSVLDFYVSLAQSATFINYNQQALPPFYTVELILAQNGPSFMKRLTFHTNFEWAINNLLLEGTKYEETAQVILKLIKLVADDDMFRAKHITLLLNSEKLATNPQHVLP